MEYIFALMFRRIVILSIFIFIFQSCGYFENDKIDYQKDIVGRIKIQKQQNSQNQNLVYAETDESFSVITDDCLIIFYDSINNMIYSECKLTESENNYFEIKIIDPNNIHVSGAIKKNKIDLHVFNLKTKGLQRK